MLGNLPFGTPSGKVSCLSGHFYPFTEMDVSPGAIVPLHQPMGQERPRDLNPLPGSEGLLSRLLYLHHVNRLQALLSLGDFKLNLVPFMKNLEPLLFNG